MYFDWFHGLQSTLNYIIVEELKKQINMFTFIKINIYWDNRKLIFSFSTKILIFWIFIISKLQVHLYHPYENYTMSLSCAHFSLKRHHQFWRNFACSFGMTRQKGFLVAMARAPLVIAPFKRKVAGGRLNLASYIKTTQTIEG